MAAARALAGRIAANPPDMLRMTKRLLREGQHTRLSTLLEMSAAFQALAHSTEDHKEAVERHAGKAPADLHGPLILLAADFHRVPQWQRRTGPNLFVRAGWEANGWRGSSRTRRSAR